MNYLIYKATLNNKVYIGKTKNIEERKKRHLLHSKIKPTNSKFYRAIEKYGFENTKWEIIYETDDLEDINKMEIFFIDKYNSIKDGYNISTGGEGGDTISNNPERNNIIKKQLITKGKDIDKYVEITDEIKCSIIDEYKNGGMIRRISKKYGITKNRIKRLLSNNNIKTEYRNDNQIIPSDELISKISDLFNNGKTIREISKISELTEMIVARILHDTGLRISSRFKDGKRYDGIRKPHHKKRISYPSKSIYEKKHILNITDFLI
jgi:group I intron endonuclease